MNKVFFAILFIAFSFLSKAQFKTTKFSFSPRGTVNCKAVDVDFYPELINIEKPKPGGIPANVRKYEKINANNKTLITPQNESLNDLGVGLNFNANSFANATPCDNDLAISDSNIIVSVINSTMAVYDVNGTSPVTVGSMSLAAFTASLGLPHDEFDPKVVYDPNEDRFILLCLNGYTDSTSSILVGFSQTNDPMGGWNLYAIPGNPLNNGLWTDYPMMALTNNELFITVNLLYPDSSWQTGFNETIIWQMNKYNGYNNIALNANLVTGIQYNGRNIRNLCPVKGGSQLYGPDMYFLSSKNFDTQSDTLFIVHVSDTAGAVGYNVSVTQLNSDADYFFAGDARQTGSHRLATNDSRVLGAFIENDKIQYVHNSLDTSTTFCGIYHGVISNVSTAPVIHGQQISDTLRDIGYPNISYAGVNASDNTAMISFDHTAPTVYPGVSAIKADGNGNYSYIRKIKDGTSYVNVLTGALERWGDYSGSQRKYNTTSGEIWSAGYLGYASGINHIHRAYIAQLLVDSPLGIADKQILANDFANVFPNPFDQLITVQFNINESKYINFQLTDLSGKQLALLMRERVKAGKNEFTFTINDLPKGVYIFNAISGSEIIVTKKIIKN